MSQAQDPSVLEFRMERLRKAPRNWTYWIAGFTALNGLFLAMQHDFMILAGLVTPFAAPGAVAHVAAAAVLIAMGYFSAKAPRLLLAALLIYVGDALFAAYAGLWSGFAMHLVVLAFVGFSFIGIRALRKVQLQQNDNGA